MSEYKFACPVCGQHITCDSASSGTQMNCPTCFRKLVVPQAKSPGSSNLVLTAALAQSRPATSLSSQTGFIARNRPSAWRRRVGMLVLVGLGLGAVAGVFAFRGEIRDLIQAQAWITSPPPASIEHRVLPVAEPSSDATNWTLNLAAAKIPDEPANGRVNGLGFALERATIQLGRLDLRQGPKWPPDVGVSIHLYAGRTEDLAGRTVTVEPTRTNAPSVILRWKNDQNQPVTKEVRGGYALRVEFGQVTGNHLPGRIYIATSDDQKSYAAGTFNAEIRKPPPKK
jgi:hypothetical protein